MSTESTDGLSNLNLSWLVVGRVLEGMRISAGPRTPGVPWRGRSGGVAGAVAGGVSVGPRRGRRVFGAEQGDANQGQGGCRQSHEQQGEFSKASHAYLFDFLGLAQPQGLLVLRPGPGRCRGTGVYDC